MPDFLLELLSEEIPARMQARAADDLRRLVTDALVERGLTYEGAKAPPGSARTWFKLAWPPRRCSTSRARLQARRQQRRE
ncbi:hypothetical protein ACIKTA_11265, partial [Hansschlegelia beijingensis]